MSAAAALADYCEQITVIDKDIRPSPVATRKYVPQGAHISILLKAGLDILCEFYPGLDRDLMNAGASRINAGCDQQVFEYGAWRMTRPLDLEFIGISRLLLESVLYERFLSLSNVQSLQAQVTGLKIESGRVKGVECGERTATIEADLVVDASGVGGVLSKWLNKHAGQSIPTDRSPIHIFYSTVHFKKPVQFLTQKENILIVPEAGVSNLGGSLLDVENDSWCVSLHGRDREPVPKTMAEWYDSIASLPDDRIWQRVKEAEPSSGLQTFKKSHAIWRRFDQCQEQLPKGYLPLGDAVNSLNPIFGQGMTIALGHCLALKQSLANGEISAENFATQNYYIQALRWTEKAWKKSAAFDKNFFSESAQDEKRIELVRKLTAAQHKKVAESPDFHLQILKEAQMLTI